MRPLRLPLLALLAAPCIAFAADAPATPAFNTDARLADVQARYSLNRERQAALGAEAAAMQREAEALMEIKRRDAEAAKSAEAAKEAPKPEEPQP